MIKAVKLWKNEKPSDLPGGIIRAFVNAWKYLIVSLNKIVDALCAQTHVLLLPIFILQAYVFDLVRRTISLQKSYQSQNVLAIEGYLKIEEINKS